MYRKDLHKIKPIHFANIESKRLQETNRINITRRSRRTEAFNLHRNIASDCLTQDSDSISGNKHLEKFKTGEKKQSHKLTGNVENKNQDDKVLDRKLALKKFRMERDAIKNELKKKQRPPFKVGIVHHGSSPILKDLTNVRMTRAMKKANSENNVKTVHLPHNNQNNSPVCFFPFQEKKSNFTFKAPFAKIKKKLTSPHTPEVLKRSAKKNPVLKKGNLKSNATGQLNLSTQPRPTCVLSILKKEEIFQSGDEGNVEEKSVTPQDNKKKKSKISLLKRKSSDVPSHGIKSNIDQKKETLRHRSQLEEHTGLLLALADKWDTQVSLHTDIPTEVMDEVDSVVGQTRLLTRDKFNQFRGLIEQLEQQDSSSTLITINDLDGFWEMIFLQVEPLVKRFADLESLKNNNWIKTEPETKKRKGGGKRLKKNKAQESKPVDNFILEPEDIQINDKTGSSKKFSFKPSKLAVVNTTTNEVRRTTRSSKSIILTVDDEENDEETEVCTNTGLMKGSSHSITLQPEDIQVNDRPSFTKKFTLKPSKLILRDNTPEVIVKRSASTRASKSLIPAEDV